jgi:hypothetical protein
VLRTLETHYLVGVHVLLVENSEDGRQMLEAALGYCGAFVTTASSAAEGQRRLHEVQPHVIITTAVEAAREAGFVAFLTKPLDPFVLGDIVRRVGRRSPPR